MTNFDERLYHALVTLADKDGQIARSARSIANLLDVSDRTIYASFGRLVKTGRITVAPSEYGHTSIVTVHPAEGIDKGVTLSTSDPAGAAQRKPLPDHPPAPQRNPDRNCRVCEGSGWVELPDKSNTVEPCRCLSPEYRAYWRAQRRAVARTWPADPPTENERPAKADYMALWLEWTRRKLKDESDGEPPPLHVVPDPDEMF